MRRHRRDPPSTSAWIWRVRESMASQFRHLTALQTTTRMQPMSTRSSRRPHVVAGSSLVAVAIVVMLAVTTPYQPSPVVYGSPGTTNYSSGAISLRVPPSGTGGSGVPANDITTSTINVPDTYTVGDVNVKVRLNHTFDSDLIISLVGPNSTTVILAKRKNPVETTTAAARLTAMAPSPHLTTRPVRRFHPARRRSPARSDRANP